MSKKENASKKQATSESTTKRTRRTFSDEYKIEAVKMVTDQGYKVAEAARSLGIQVNLLHYIAGKTSQVGQAVPDEMGERGLLIRFYDVLTCCITTIKFKHCLRTQRQAQPDLRHCRLF